MKRLLLLLLFSSLSFSGFSQKEKWCEAYQKELTESFKTKDPEQIRNAYNRLMNVCGLDYITVEHIEKVKKAFHDKEINNMVIGRFGNIEYQFKDPTLGFLDYDITFEKLSKNDPLKKKYPVKDSLNAKLQTLGLDSVKIFIPDEQLMVVKVGKYSGIYDYNFKEVLGPKFENIFNYGMPNLVLLIQLGKSQFFNLKERKLDDKIYEYINYNVKTGKETGFHVASIGAHSFIFDYNGKLKKEIDGHVYYQPLVNAFIVSKDGVKELIDLDFKKLIGPFKNASFFTVNGQRFVGTVDTGGKETLWDAYFKPVFSYPKYERVGLGFDNTILINKDGKVGLVSTLTGKEVLPFGKEMIYYLTSNILVKVFEDHIAIIDDKGRELRTIPDLNVQLLNELGQILFINQKEDKYGISDLWGNEILPVTFENVRASPFGPQIIIYDRNTGDDIFYDYKGQKIPLK